MADRSPEGLKAIFNQWSATLLRLRDTSDEEDIQWPLLDNKTYSIATLPNLLKCE